MNSEYQARQWNTWSELPPPYYGAPAERPQANPAYRPPAYPVAVPAWKSDLHDLSVHPYEGDGLPIIPFQDVAVLQPHAYAARSRQAVRRTGLHIVSVSLFVTGMSGLAALCAYYVLSCYGLF